VNNPTAKAGGLWLQRHLHDVGASPNRRKPFSAPYMLMAKAKGIKGITAHVDNLIPCHARGQWNPNTAREMRT
jgi:hypothetical protein